MLTPSNHFPSLSVEIRTKNLAYLFTNPEYISIINLCSDFIKYSSNRFIKVLILVNLLRIHSYIQRNQDEGDGFINYSRDSVNQVYIFTRQMFI